MYSYIKNAKALRFGSNEILKFTAKYPSFAESKAPEELYAKLADEAFNWCKTEEYPLLCSVFEEKKKERSPFSRYCYNFTATVQDSDESFATVKLTVVLHEERHLPIFRFEENTIWSLEHGLICKKRKKGVC